MQSYIANQESVKFLCWLKLVCKVWHEVVNVTLKSKEWLAPFTQSADVFIEGGIMLPSLPPHADTNQAYRNECSKILDSFLDKLQLHRWFEAVQYDGVVKLNKVLTWLIWRKLRLHEVTFRRMLYVVIHTMKVRDLVERVQVAGCRTIVLLSDLRHLRMQFFLLPLNNSPLLNCCIRNIRNFSLNASLMDDVLCIIYRFIQIGRPYEDSAVGKGVIELVVSVIAQHSDCPSLQVMAHKIFRSVSLANFPYIKEAKLDKIVFRFMRKFPENRLVQVSCMDMLNFLFDRCVSCASCDLAFDIDLYDDLGGFELIRLSILAFPHEFPMLHLVLKVFANVVVLDKREMCRQIVKDDCIGLIFHCADNLVLGANNAYEIQHIHLSVCKILLGISHDKTLHPALATARVSDFMQQVMTDYIHHDGICFVACNILRQVFYPATMLRRNMAPLAIVELVLKGLTMHIDEMCMRDECILTIDILMQSKRSISLVSSSGGTLQIIKALYLCTHITAIRSDTILAGFRMLTRLSLYRSNIALIVENPDPKICISSIATSAMSLYPTDTLVQTAALYILDKFVSGFPHKHTAFRRGKGPALLRAAMKLPDLDHEVKAVALKTLRRCQLHVTRL